MPNLEVIETALRGDSEKFRYFYTLH